MHKWYYILSLPVITLCFLSCGKDDIAELTEGPSHVKFSINGATFNGVYEITHDQMTDTTELKATALIVPADQDYPEMMIITYQDNAQQLSVAMQVPTGKGIVDPPLGWQPPNGLNNPYNLEVTFPEGICVSTNVNMTITEYEKKAHALFLYGIPYAVGSFEGTMVYENEENQEEIHTITGDFKYSLL